MESQIQDFASTQCLEQLSDRSEVEMTTDTEAERPGSGSSAEQQPEQFGMHASQRPFALGTKNQSSQGPMPAERHPSRPSVFHAWQQSLGYTRNRVLASVKTSIAQQRKESMRTYKLSKRDSSKVDTSQQTENQIDSSEHSDRNLDSCLDLAKLQRGIEMVKQDANFAACLNGLMTLNSLTSEHVKNFSTFFTYSAMIIESGVLDRLNRILMADESEFDADFPIQSSAFLLRESEMESCSALMQAKGEALNILINLSHNNEQHVNFMVNHGCIAVLCH